MNLSLWWNRWLIKQAEKLRELEDPFSIDIDEMHEKRLPDRYDD